MTGKKYVVQFTTLNVKVMEIVNVMRIVFERRNKIYIQSKVARCLATKEFNQSDPVQAS